MSNREIIYYNLQPVYRPDRPTISSAAMMPCMFECGNWASGSGGPSKGICKDCGDKISSGKYGLSLNKTKA